MRTEQKRRTEKPRARKTASVAHRLSTATREMARVRDDQVAVAIANEGNFVFHTSSVPRASEVDLELAVQILFRVHERLTADRRVRLGGSRLSRAEEELLKDGGFDDAPQSGVSPEDEGVMEYVTLLEDSLTAAEAAKRLGVNASRIRQRSAAGELLAIKDGASWKLPRFQFLKNRLVPGIDRVLPFFKTMNPVSTYRWFMTPHPDLELNEKEIATPLEWLLGGHEVNDVVAIAESLH